MKPENMTLIQALLARLSLPGDAFYPTKHKKASKEMLDYFHVSTVVMEKNGKLFVKGVTYRKKI